MSSKLKNIKAVGELLEGRHKSQTRKTFWMGVPVKDVETRAVGEVWEEVDFYGNKTVWKQKEGYRIKNYSEDFSDLKKYLDYRNCRSDCSKKTTGLYDHLDEIFRKKQNRCFDCVLREETLLKSQGKYRDYEKEKILANKKDWLKDARVEMEKLKERLGKMELVFADGRTEAWTMENKKAFLDKIDHDFAKLEEDLLRDT